MRIIWMSSNLPGWPEDAEVGRARKTAKRAGPLSIALPKAAPQASPVKLKIRGAKAALRNLMPLVSLFFEFRAEFGGA